MVAFVFYSSILFPATMQKMCSKHQCLDWALLILRVALGIVFVYHGYGKLFGNNPGMDKFIQMVAGIGFPAPALFAYLAALSEFVGGIAIILGIYTHVFGTLIAIVMLVAFLIVKKAKIPSGDADLSLFAMAVAIVLAGPGSFVAWKKGAMGCCGGTCSTKEGK